MISGNRWGGIDIRRGGDPRIIRNLICNGLADGIVVGVKGKASIEGNCIRGNMGCGIWVMSGRPLIQSNQIYNNKDAGIVLVDKVSVLFFYLSFCCTFKGDGSLLGRIAR